MKACRECQNDDLREGVHGPDQQPEALFFGPENPRNAFIPVYPKGGVQGSGASKRTAFEGAMSTVKRGAEELLSDIDEQGRVSHYRAILLETLREFSRGERPEVTWSTLTEDGNCCDARFTRKCAPMARLSCVFPNMLRSKSAASRACEVKRRKMPVIVEPFEDDSSDEFSFTYWAAPAGTSDSVR